jgi:hypothetical protein
MLDLNTLDWKFIAITGQFLVFVFGLGWSLYKLNEFRELKYAVELEIDANIYQLSNPRTADSFTWDQEGNRVTKSEMVHTHAVEILLKFNNKSKRRFRIYNIQIAINTMRPPSDTKFDEKGGQVKLKRLFTSGNVVPEMPIPDKPIEKTSFYYMEPGTSQIIDYLALISEPDELLTVIAKFSLEQSRIFPEQNRTGSGLYPHTASKTYQLKSINVATINS